MTSNMDLLHRAIDRWNAGDLNGYLELYDPSIRLHGYTPEPMDKAAVTGFYNQIWDSLAEAGRPNPKLEVLDALEADSKIACRFRMSGIHSGEFMHVPASSARYALPGITILRFENGRVVERWSSADMLGLLIQIGAIPAPAAAA